MSAAAVACLLYLDGLVLTCLSIVCGALITGMARPTFIQGARAFVVCLMWPVSAVPMLAATISDMRRPPPPPGDSA